MYGAEDIAEGNFRGCAGEEVTAFFAADAFGDAFGFQFEEDLNEVIGRHALRGGEVLDAQRGFIRKMPRQFQHCARGIIAFDRKLHREKLADDHQTAIMFGEVRQRRQRRCSGARPFRRFSVQASVEVMGPWALGW